MKNRIDRLERSLPKRGCPTCGHRPECENCARWHYHRVEAGSVEQEVFAAAAARAGVEWPRVACPECGCYWVGIDTYRRLLLAMTDEDARKLGE